MNERGGGPSWASGGRVELDDGGGAGCPRDPSTHPPTKPGPTDAAFTEPPQRNAEPPRAARARTAAARTLARAASGARGLAERAAASGGAAERAGPLARSTAQRLDAMAGYVRATETEKIFTDLEAAIRRHPVRALTIAFVAGYLTRRIL